jgi:tetratricopeptide (TPR) repeat protein
VPASRGAGDPKQVEYPELTANTEAAREQFRRGVALLKSGQTVAAMPPLLAACRSDTTYFEAHHALASALMRNGRFADAVAILQRAVELRPESAAAWQDLGTSYDRQNQHDNAIAAYSRTVELVPKLSRIHCRLGEIYAMYSRTEEASACFERAADTETNATIARLVRSDALLLRGDMAAAERWAREAVDRDPKSHAANGALAGLLYAQGRFEEAAEHYAAAVAQNPKAVRCWDGLVHCRSFSGDDADILDRMRTVLQRPDLNDMERMTVHFAMGKVFDDCGEYAHAMEQFDAANALRAKDLKFDRAGLAALVDRTIERFTPEFMARNAALGSPDSRPLFIVGMVRSGTTLVEQILSRHPDIAAGGELTVWTPADIEIEPTTAEFDLDRTRAAIAKYLSVLERIGPSAARVTDKMPFNFFRLGAIHALMPNARIVHCRRDPVDTSLSIYMTLFNTRVGFAARKDDLVFYYRQYQRMMDHWRKVLPANVFLEVDYERLIADRESETRRLIAFTGLEWNDDCLAPEQNKRSIRTASAWQARQPVYTTSMQRWRRYEPWIGELRHLLPA